VSLGKTLKVNFALLWPNSLLSCWSISLTNDLLIEPKKCFVLQYYYSIRMKHQSKNHLRIETNTGSIRT